MNAQQVAHDLMFDIKDQLTIQAAAGDKDSELAFIQYTAIYN